MVVRGSFHHASRVETPSSLLTNHGLWGSRVRLVGVVGTGSIKSRRDGVRFAIKDEHGSGHVTVRYAGDIPNQLRGGLVVEVTGSFGGRAFAAQPSTLVVICARTQPQEHC